MVEQLLENIEQALKDFDYETAKYYINELIFEVGVEETSELLERFDLYLS